MIKLSLIIISLFAVTQAMAQGTIEVSFKNTNETFDRADKEVTYPITIKVDKEKYIKSTPDLNVVSIKTNDAKSSFARKDYALNFNSVPLEKLANEYTFYITIKDTSLTEDKHLILNIEISNAGDLVNLNSAKANTELDILIKSRKQFKQYNYLAYVGTNFDLVDGIKAKNLFFATNSFVPPKGKGKGFGFNLTLYGNRTLTATDSSSKVRIASRIVGLGGDSARTYFDEATKTVSRVTDNLGGSFSPLIRIGKTMGNSNRSTQLYYAPQFEFIWRRTKMTTAYTDKKLVDSVTRQNRPIVGSINLTPEMETASFNVYDVYLGLIGALLNHENEHIIIRVQSSVGFNITYTALGKVAMADLKTQYDRKVNIFSFTRAWIMEPKSGVTFGAEVSNTFLKKNGYQPYFNVTLSKALNMSGLAGLFKL
jgi:hypothetical protein